MSTHITRFSGDDAPDLAALAAKAYLSGWALTEGPLTDRARAGCAAAVATALEHPDDPHVLEVSLLLGSLEGTWKIIYDRRDKLLRKHLRLIARAWDACLAGLDPRDVVHRFRQVMDFTAETAAKDPDKAWWKDAATTLALGWLRKLYQSAGYAALLAAIEDAIRSGMAEGEAGALALAASRQGKTGFRIDAAFKAAYQRLADDRQVSQQAADAVIRIVNGAAADAGRELADQAGDDGTEDGMTSAVGDAVSGSGSRSLATWADWALWAGIGLGALALYWNAGAVGWDGSSAAPAVMIDWITAGDSHVCVAICQENEDNSPYSLGDVPSYPGHPRCRCYLDSSDPDMSARLMAYYFG